MTTSVRRAGIQLALLTLALGAVLGGQAYAAIQIGRWLFAGAPIDWSELPSAMAWSAVAAIGSAAIAALVLRYRPAR